MKISKNPEKNPPKCPLCEENHYLKIDGTCCKNQTFKNLNTSLVLSDLNTSNTISWLSEELGKAPYDFDTINFKSGDIVIDIGGNIGITAIYLLKKFPFLKIYSFEPIKLNYNNFKKNLVLNNISQENIIINNLALSKDGRNVSFMFEKINTGASVMSELRIGKRGNYLREDEIAESISLNEVFEKYRIKKCKLLKIDCEGCEYEVIYNTMEKYLKRCEFVRMEVHTNNFLELLYGNPLDLVYYIKNYSNVEYLLRKGF